MSRKICIVTGTRAEYGLLKWTLKEIAEDPSLELQIIATGMHVSPEFGLTWKEIEADGFKITRKVEMLTSSDTQVGITKAMGLGLIGFADALNELKPDLILILGDRFEIFSAATAAMIARIPIGHIHGGERTEGAVDEAIRHSLTKMAHLHFVATKEYEKRVIQLGEAPERVFIVGGLGTDCIRKTTLLDRPNLENALGCSIGNKSLLITFHPTTLEIGTAKAQMAELLSALSDLHDTTLIFTYPNADTDGRELIHQIRAFVVSHPNARVYPSLGQQVYLSCLREVDGIIGNSSSGLLEAPSFKTGTINIGDRQRGRTQAKSVLNCQPDRNEIHNALTQLRSPIFQKSLRTVRNPYGDGGASTKILDIIKNVNLETIIKKPFFDLKNKKIKR